MHKSQAGVCMLSTSIALTPSLFRSAEDQAMQLASWFNKALEVCKGDAEARREVEAAWRKVLVRLGDSECRRGSSSDAKTARVWFSKALELCGSEDAEARCEVKGAWREGATAAGKAEVLATVQRRGMQRHGGMRHGMHSAGQAAGSTNGDDEMEKIEGWIAMAMEACSGDDEGARCKVHGTFCDAMAEAGRAEAEQAGSGIKQVCIDSQHRRCILLACL